MENTTNFQPYRCVLTGGTAEITEKKSRFIATVRRTESEEEAVSFIEEMKKKYWDASHNCSAFVLSLIHIYGIYFPLSDNWKKKENRIADCTWRIRRLLDKLEDRN